MEKQSEDIDSAFEAKDYRKALFHIEQSLNIALASKRLKVKKAECLAYLGKLEMIHFTGDIYENHVPQHLLPF